MLCTGISLRTEDCVRGSSYVWVNTVYKTTTVLLVLYGCEIWNFITITCAPERDQIRVQKMHIK